MEWHSPFVGAMKIARNPGFSGRPDEWQTPFVGAMKIARHPRTLASTPMNGASPPGSLPEGAVERSETEGVSFVEWYNVMSSEFRRGDENRPPTPDISEYPDEWHPPIPGSLSEGAVERTRD